MTDDVDIFGKLILVVCSGIFGDLLNSTAAIAAMITAATKDTTIATNAPADKPEFVLLYIFKLLRLIFPEGNYLVV